MGPDHEATVVQVVVVVLADQHAAGRDAPVRLFVLPQDLQGLRKVIEEEPGPRLVEQSPLPDLLLQARRHVREISMHLVLVSARLLLLRAQHSVGLHHCERSALDLLEGPP